MCQGIVKQLSSYGLGTLRTMSCVWVEHEDYKTERQRFPRDLRDFRLNLVQ
jgi:hypothetical protein